MNAQPNIVFIITDQQRLDTIAANGFDHMTTPHLDKLVQNGANFENMYVTAPVCSPSRASLFSGTYPHTNGVYRNDEPWNYSWVNLLNQAGYHCVNVGKMHTCPMEGAFGFHERHVVENKDRDHPGLPFFLDNWDKALHARKAYKPSRYVHYPDLPDYEERLGAFIWEQDEDLHPDVFVGETACWWLDRFRGGKPFFLEIGFPGPHPPYDPTQDYADLYEGRDLPMPIRDYDLDEQPEPLRRLRHNHTLHPHDAVVHLENPTEEQMYRQRQYYYANMTMIDEQVGHIVAKLEAMGEIDNTLIIFTSDHGDCLNDHGHSQKWNMYEASVHVPAVMCWPGKVKPGTKVADLVSLMDFGPTILEAAGCEVPDWMEAKPLQDVLLGDRDVDRPRVFAECANDGLLDGTNFMTMVREGPWKLVHFVDHDDGQLFNLDDDPGERRSLWHDPAHQEVKQRLETELLKWRIEAGRKTQGFVRELADATRK